MFNLKFIKMKAKILSFLFILSAALLISSSVFAGGNQAPSPGQTITYSVTSGLTSYDWKVTTNGTTLADPADYSWTQGTAATQDIKWLAPSAGKTYIIWVQATDATGCKTDPKTWTVNVTNTQFCIAPNATVVGGVTPAAPTNKTQCSLLTAGTTGTNLSTYGDATTFFATITGGVPNLVAGSAYSVTYTISDGTNTSTETTGFDLITNGSGAGALSITVNATSYVNQFTAPNGTGAKTVTITVTKVTYAGVDVTNPCTDNHYDVAVHELPKIDF